MRVQGLRGLGLRVSKVYIKFKVFMIMGCLSFVLALASDQRHTGVCWASGLVDRLLAGSMAIVDIS